MHSAKSVNLDRPHKCEMHNVQAVNKIHVETYIIE